MTGAPPLAPSPMADLEAAIEDHVHALAPAEAAGALLLVGERVLERWLAAHGKTPTSATAEGFRLLALHRQGAKGDPSFNACRETCRELVYHHNLITLDPHHADTGRRLVMMALVARHLVYFVGGKLEAAGLGEFCCAARPIRSADRG